MLYKDGFKLLYYSRHIITCTSWTYIYTEHKCTSIPVTFLVTAFIANFINFIYFEGAGRDKDLLHMKYWLWYYQGRIYVPGTINKIL